MTSFPTSWVNGDTQPALDVRAVMASLREVSGAEPTTMVVGPAVYDHLHLLNKTTFGPFHKPWPDLNDLVSPRYTRLARRLARRRRELRWWWQDRREARHPDRYW